MNSLPIKSFVPIFFVTIVSTVWGHVNEIVATSDREVPVVERVDVLVLGGSTGAVAAAQEAAKSGAKTMLLTDLPYLGEDMTATLRLWDESTTDETDPLRSKIANDPISDMADDDELQRLIRRPDKIPFEYSVLQDINGNHPETAEKNRLSDGLAFSVRTQSLQVNGDADVVLDFGKVKKAALVSLLAFYRPRHFAIEKVEVFRSEDGDSWKPVGTAFRDRTQFAAADSAVPYTLELPEPVETRFLKLSAKLEATSRIALLAEIIVSKNPKRSIEQSETAGEGKSAPLEYPRPLHVKRVLDQALIDSGVRFLCGTYTTGFVVNAKAETRGALITSRSGRQAVLAKAIIDARSDARELLDTYGPEDDAVQIEFVVIGGRPVDVAERLKTGRDSGTFRLLRSGRCDVMEKSFRSYWPNPAQSDGGEFQVFRYTFELDRRDAETVFGGDMSLYARLESEVRGACYHHDMQFAADRFVLRPGSKKPESLKLGNLTGADAILAGRELGRKAAADVAGREIENLRTLRTVGASPKNPESRPVAGDVRELLDGMRPYEKPIGSVPEAGLDIPIVASYDVVVVGGGTTGAPAAIAAARNGAKTLVVDYHHDLGGVGTVGAIAGYYWGNRVGFTEEISQGAKSWKTVHKSRHWFSLLRQAGGDAWFGVLGAGAFVDPKTDADGRTVVRGVLLATPFGPQIVRAKIVIDTTGNGDIAQTAGADMEFVSEGEIAVQGAGFSPRFLGGRYMNNDFSYIDDTDPIDATHVYVYGKGKFPHAFDMSRMLNTRERRRIVGEFTITLLDQLNERTYPDSIARSFSNFDSHGYTTDPYLDVAHPKKVGIHTYYPYRSSIPKGIDGMLVGALATSCHRDALPLIRMQADLQNQGYGLGHAASTAVKDGVRVRDVDIRKVQRHLVEIGNLPESALEETDNYESSRAGLDEAVRSIANDFDRLPLVMWHPEESLPLLRKAHAEASDFDTKFIYAKVLAGLDDAAGKETLLEFLRKNEAWDDGWNFKAMSQFGMASGEQDQVIMMLGRIKSRRAVPLIVRKLNLLRKEDAFSHHRACFLALERVGDPSAAKALADHLNKPGMKGFVHDTIETAARRDREDPNVALGEKSRRDSLIEIGTAAALYRLGDVDGQGRRILEAYRKDLRGHFARHAAELLRPSP